MPKFPPFEAELKKKEAADFNSSDVNLLHHLALKIQIILFSLIENIISSCEKRSALSKIFSKTFDNIALSVDIKSEFENPV